MPAFITQVLVPILLGLELANSVWCGDLAGLTDTRVLGFDQHGTPVVWKDGVSPYEIPKSRHTGEVEVWFPRHPPTPFTNFGKQEGYHYMFQVWFTYNEAGFTPTTGGLSDVGTGKAGATQLDRSHWGRVFHDVDFLAIEVVLKDPAGFGSNPLDKQLEPAEPGQGSGGTSVSIKQVFTLPSSRKELINSAYISVDASDIERWMDVRVYFKIRPSEDKALLLHANMVAWGEK